MRNQMPSYANRTRFGNTIGCSGMDADAASLVAQGYLYKRCLIKRNRRTFDLCIHLFRISNFPFWWDDLYDADMYSMTRL